LEGAVTAGLIALLIGVLLTWIGWRHWRYRKQDSIGILEASILKVAGEEPLPRTKFDRLMGYTQAILGLTLGPFFLLVGFVVIASELELL
jgi:hypothetical protein